MSDADLSQFGLARCRRCRRILLTAHLEKGRCKPGNDCAAHDLIRRAWEDGHPDAIAFARAIEAALYGEAYGSVPLQRMSEPAKEEVGLLLSVPASLPESPSEALR